MNYFLWLRSRTFRIWFPGDQPATRPRARRCFPAVPGCFRSPSIDHRETPPRTCRHNCSILVTTDTFQDFFRTYSQHIRMRAEEAIWVGLKGAIE